MKKSLMSFLIGVIVGSLFFGTISFGDDEGTLIRVYYNIKDIVINKVSKMPDKDKPFVYEGRTYVPLRFISENLGYDVDWDYETSSVLVGEVEGSNHVYPGEKPNGIDYLNYQEGHIFNSFRYGYNTNILLDNVGTEFDSYILLYISNMAVKEDAWNYLEFPLNKQYKTFNGKLGLTGKYQNTTSDIVLEIFIDDELVFEKGLKAGEIPKEINLNIENGDKITFKMSTNGESEAEIGLFDAYFIK